MFTCISNLHVVSAVKKSTWNLSFWVWLISLNIIFSCYFIQRLFSLIKFHCVCIPHFLYLFICWDWFPIVNSTALNRCRSASIDVVCWPRILWIYNTLIYRIEYCKAINRGTIFSFCEQLYSTLAPTVYIPILYEEPLLHPCQYLLLSIFLLVAILTRVR